MWCRFYDTAIPISMMQFFQKMAVAPEDLPDIIFASIGRTIWKVGSSKSVGSSNGVSGMFQHPSWEGGAQRCQHMQASWWAGTAVAAAGWFIMLSRWSEGCLLLPTLCRTLAMWPLVSGCWRNWWT